jgi:hypothetical protein
MKKLLNIITGAAFIAALGIVGAVERGADINLMWWTIPLIAVMAIAAGVQEFTNKKYFFEEVTKARN